MPETREPRGLAHLLPAALVSAALCAIAYALASAPFPPFTVETPSGSRHPIGPAILAILLGVLVRNSLELPAAIRRGIKPVIALTIPAAIVLGAAELDLRSMANLSLSALGITMACIVIAFFGGYGAARLLGLSRRLGVLLGGGTAICGNTAVVTLAPIVRADDREVGIAIGTINLMGLIVMLALPPLGTALMLSPQTFGIWAGTTIHAVPQVAAAGETYGAHAAVIATLVKLVRVAMLAPLVIAVAFAAARARRAETGTADRLDGATMLRYLGVVPWFVWGFLVVATINTLGWMPKIPWGAETIPLGPICRKIAGALLATAMAAIGLEIDLPALARTGVRGVMAGAIAAVLLVVTSLAMTGWMEE